MSQKREPVFYMYRNLKGNSRFTGFVTTKSGEITWIGKNENQFRPIKSQEDVDFFMKHMRQYDK